MEKINWISMLLASIVPAFVAMIFYSKMLFANSSSDPLSLRSKILGRKNRISFFVVSCLASFLLAFFLQNFNNSGINQEGDFDNFLHGAWHGIFIAITTATPILVINALMDKKSWKNTLVHIFYWITTLALMGGILDAMNHWENVVLSH